MPRHSTRILRGGIRGALHQVRNPNYALESREQLRGKLCNPTLTGLARRQIQRQLELGIHV